MIVLIPAKGCSIRIPKKNLQPLTDEHTLLSWAVANWQQILPGVEIVVATESQEVASVAVSLGCKIHHEELELLANQKRQATALLCEFARTTETRPIILTECTSPFTLRSEALAGLRHSGSLVRSGYSSVVHRPANQFRLSQDIEPEMAVTGNFLIVREDPSAITDWMPPGSISPVSLVSSLDINEPRELEYAKWLAKRITLADLLDV